MKINFNKILFVVFMWIVFAGLLFSLFLKQPVQIYKPSKTKVIERRIEGKETIIEKHVQDITGQRTAINSLAMEVSSLTDELMRLKRQKDTVKIIQIQDTMINVLVRQGTHKDSVINYQDSIIVAQRYIIDSKDTLLQISRADFKRVRKQRNWSLISNGILAGLLIIK